jgi:hypothetical protein
VIRAELKPEAYRGVAEMFARHLHDPVLPFNLQISCARYTASFVETVSKSSDQKGLVRPILLFFLESFTNKFRSLKHSVPALLAAHPAHKEPLPAVAPGSPQTPPPPLPIELRDCRHLIRYLPGMLKGNIWGVFSIAATVTGGAPPPSQPPQQQQQQQPQQPSSPPIFMLSKSGMSEEAELLASLIKNGFECMDVFATALIEERREVYEPFYHLLHQLDSKIFKCVVESLVQFLFDHLVRYPGSQRFFEMMLGNPPISLQFVDVILPFLMSRFAGLSDSPPYAAAYVSLFKLVVNSAVPIPRALEALFSPHLSTMIGACMRYSSEGNSYHFELLRHLFKQTSQPNLKCDSMLREHIPTLSMLFDNLEKMRQFCSPSTVKQIIEIPLHEPLRMSILIPFLHQIVPFVAAALAAPMETFYLALRLLEFCADNLIPPYFDAVIGPWKEELVRLLRRHVRVPISLMTGVVVHILGKLSGRCRDIRPQPIVPERDNVTRDDDEEGCSLLVAFQDSPVPFKLKLGRYVMQTKRFALATHGQTRAHFLLAKALFSLFVSKKNADSIALLLRGQPPFSAKTDTFPPRLIKENRGEEPGGVAVKTKERFEVERSAIENTLVVILAASIDEKLRAEAEPFTRSVLRHFALLLALDDAAATAPGQCDLRYIDATIIVDALAVLFCSDNKPLVQGAQAAAATLLADVMLLAPAADSEFQ